MKKWIGVFIAVSAVVLLVVRSVAGEDLAEHSEFGQIQEENGYISQIAQCDNEDYVIYKNTELGNIQIEKIKNKGQRAICNQPVRWQRAGRKERKTPTVAIASPSISREPEE